MHYYYFLFIYVTASLILTENIFTEKNTNVSHVSILISEAIQDSKMKIPQYLNNKPLVFNKKNCLIYL